MKALNLAYGLSLASLLIPSVNYAGEKPGPEIRFPKADGTQFEMKADLNPGLAELEKDIALNGKDRTKAYQKIERRGELPPSLSNRFKASTQNGLWKTSEKSQNVSIVSSVEHQGSTYYVVKELAPQSPSYGTGYVENATRIYSQEGKLLSQAPGALYLNERLNWTRTAEAIPKTLPKELKDALSVLKKYSGRVGGVLGAAGAASLLSQISDANSKTLDASIGPARESSESGSAAASAGSAR